MKFDIKSNKTDNLQFQKIGVYKWNECKDKEDKDSTRHYIQRVINKAESFDKDFEKGLVSINFFKSQKEIFVARFQSFIDANKHLFSEKKPVEKVK